MQRQQVEKFTPDSLSGLCTDLQRSGVDFRLAAELVGSFLSTRGYGVALDDLLCASTPIRSFAGSPQRMQEQLERVAVCM